MRRWRLGYAYRAGKPAERLPDVVQARNVADAMAEGARRYPQFRVQQFAAVEVDPETPLWDRTCPRDDVDTAYPNGKPRPLTGS